MRSRTERGDVVDGTISSALLCSVDASQMPKPLGSTRKKYVTLQTGNGSQEGQWQSVQPAVEKVGAPVAVDLERPEA